MSEGLTTLLRAGASMGDHGLVTDAAAAIAATDDSLLAQQLMSGSQAEARHAFVAYGQRAEMILGHCLPVGAGDEAPPWLYELVSNRKGVLAERQGTAWLQAQRERGASAGLIERLREARAEMTRLDLDGTETDAIRRSRRRHREAEREAGRIEAELHRELGTAGQPVPHVAPLDVKATLGIGTLLLDITTVLDPAGSSHYVAFLVAADGPVRFRFLGPVDAVDRKLRALMSMFARPGGHGDDPRSRIAETAPSILGAGDELAEHLVISPTGLWARVPHCLLLGISGRPLIDDHVVTLVPSARWLVARAQRRRTADDPPSGPPAVLGDPPHLSPDRRSSELRVVPLAGRRRRHHRADDELLPSPDQRPGDGSSAARRPARCPRAPS